MIAYLKLLLVRFRILILQANIERANGLLMDYSRRLKLRQNDLLRLRGGK